MGTLTESIKYSGEGNPLLEIKFPESYLGKKQLRIEFFDNVVKPFLKYLGQLDIFFTSFIDQEEEYRYFFLHQKDLSENEIAKGHIYHLYTIPASDKEHIKLKGEIIFFSNGTAKLNYYQETDLAPKEYSLLKEEEKFTNIKQEGPWRVVFCEYLKAIIGSFETIGKIYKKIKTIDQEIEKLHQAIRKLSNIDIE